MESPRRVCFVWMVICVLLVQLSCLVSSLPKPCPKFDILYGRTRARSRGRAMRVTCNRGYNLIGERTLLCNKGRWDSDLPVCAKTGCKLPEGRIPGGRVLASYRDQILRTVCEDGFELQGSPLIFCNGIVWNDTLPLCVGKPGVKACDFEGKDHFCGWHQTRGMLAWQMGYDPLESWVSNYAPDFDHTYGVGSFGHYIHMKGPIDDNPFVTSGQLKSPFYRKPENPHVCFQFWYHVFGEEAGDLKVMVNREVVWSKQQINRKLWQRGGFQFAANSTYQIIIEATIPHDMVTVAVDDLEVIENCTGLADYNAFQSTGSSCLGRCGEDGSLEDCSCDDDCRDMDNCCPDYAYFCTNTSVDTTNAAGTTAMVTNGNPITTLLAEVEEATSPTVEQINLNNENNIKQASDSGTDQISQTTLNTNEDNRSETKENNDGEAETSVSTTMENESQLTITKTIETIGSQNNELFSGTNEIDVPVDDSNETVTGRVSDIIGYGSTNQSETKEGGITDPMNNVTHTIQDVLQNNSNDKNALDSSLSGQELQAVTDQPEEKIEDDNDQVKANQSGMSFHPNESTNKKRMRESVKKSTVEYSDDENQVNPTSNKDAATEPIDYNNKDQIDKINGQSNLDITTEANLIRERIKEQETKEHLKFDSGDHSVTTNWTGDRNIIKPVKIETNDNANVPQNESISENDTALLTNKNGNFESALNASSSNKNYTKIILYKNSHNENNTNQNSSGVMLGNDISRVQIHTNVQPNGVFVENVKISSQEKYNESTIARLKIINEHIANVISKRNKTITPNATSGEINNNATALHKLKNFITTIIDSHNNSTMFNNSYTDNINSENRTNVGLINGSAEMHQNATQDGNMNLANNSSDETDLQLKEVSSENIAMGLSQATPKLGHYSEGAINTNQSTGEPYTPTLDLLSGTPNKRNRETNNEVFKDQLIDSASLELNLESVTKYQSPLPGSSVTTSVVNGMEKTSNTTGDHDSYPGNSTSPKVFNNVSDNVTSSLFSNASKTLNTSRSVPSSQFKSRFIITRRPFRLNTPWKLNGTKPLITLPANVSLSPFYNFTGLNIKRVNISTAMRNMTLLRNATTLSPFSRWASRFRTTTMKSNTTRSNLPWTRRGWFWRNTTQTTPNSRNVTAYSINLLKSTNTSLGVIGVDDSVRYEVWESSTGTQREEFIVHSAPSMNDVNHDKSSMVSITTILLVLLAVTLSTFASYCLVQRYRRPPSDDTEIEYLTGDELLYFHTPSPHLKSSRASRLSSEDDGTL